MVLPGIAFLAAGAAMVLGGLYDRHDPAALDRWNRNLSIPPQDTVGRRQMDSFVVAVGVVFMVVGAALLVR